MFSSQDASSGVKWVGLMFFAWEKDMSPPVTGILVVQLLHPGLKLETLTVRGTSNV